MRPSTSSESLSFFSSRTRSRTRTNGDKILLLERMRQKSFFGVGPYLLLAIFKDMIFLVPYLELEHIPDTVDANEDKISCFIIIFVQKLN